MLYHVRTLVVPLQRNKASKALSVSRLPYSLCLHLCRKVPNQLGVMTKLNHHVEFSFTLTLNEFLDVSGYMRGHGTSSTTPNSVASTPRVYSGLKWASKVKDNMSSLYHLRSVVVHSGSADGGAYPVLY